MAPNRHTKVDWAAVGPRALAALEDWIAEHGTVRGAIPGTVRSANLPQVTITRLNNWLIRQQRDAWEATKARGLARYRGDPEPAPRPALHNDPVPLDPADPEIRTLERKVGELRRQKRDLQRKLTAADQQHTLVGELEQVLRNEIVPLDVRPLAAPRPQRHAIPVDAVLLLSDEHGDHVVQGPATWGLERYDFNVFRCRLYRLAKVVSAFAREHLNNYHFERLWVAKLGDALHGDIHDMKLRNFFANTIRAAVAVGDAEADFVAKMADVFSEVVVVSVPGNHTRTGKKPESEDPHDTMDFLVTTHLATRLAHYIDAGRVQVHAPRAFTAFMDVRGWTCALNHGEDVRSTWGIPWYGFDRKEGRVRALVQRAGAQVDYFFYGHFHQPTQRSSALGWSVHNGAFYFSDSWQTKRLAVGTTPTQMLLVYQDREPERGHIYEVPIYLRDPEAERRNLAGEWDPPLGRETILETVGTADDLADEGRFPIIRAGEAS